MPCKLRTYTTGTPKPGCPTSLQKISWLHRAHLISNNLLQSNFTWTNFKGLPVKVCWSESSLNWNRYVVPCYHHKVKELHRMFEWYSNPFICHSCYLQADVQYLEPLYTAVSCCTCALRPAVVMSWITVSKLSWTISLRKHPVFRLEKGAFVWYSWLTSTRMPFLCDRASCRSKAVAMAMTLVGSKII